MINPMSVPAALRFLRPRAAVPRKTDHAIVARVRDAAVRCANLSDAALARQMADLRQVVQGETDAASDDVVVPAFALTVEAARRALGIELYDVQLLGGVALARGAVAEMQTGEGKTFTALLPAVLHALAGAGVHVMTVNPYLARRDYELLAPAYRLLGLSVGLIEPEAAPMGKRAAYDSDITYGPGYEFGFDYLRDQVAVIAQHQPRLGERFRDRLRGRSFDKAKPMQRGHAVAILDEADSVMIDEATTPLILSAGSRVPATNAEVYAAALHRAAQLEIDRDFVVDESRATLRLTEQGIKQLVADSNKVMRHELDRPWQVYVEQALRSERDLRRDVHYIVRDDEIHLVDQCTGRIFADRSWQEGLQQAVQAKEGVTITAETKSIVRITRQRFFRLYKHLCGMTGTAQGSERELRNEYGLNVVVIPPHRPCQLRTLPARVFADRGSKEHAIVDEIVRIGKTRQPILVGTAAIETSERLARLLDARGISYQLLNGRQDLDEAEVVSGAGSLGAITIATNMAGRGTDISLERGVAELGGLHVIVTEPQQSARVDRQLVGRAARQGDPGSCQLFASAADDLFTRHAPTLARRISQAATHNGEIPNTSDFGMVRKIRKVQHRVEIAQAQHRRELFAHDSWLESVLSDLTGSQ
jgi:preprotein translocase subunit SecA